MFDAPILRFVPAFFFYWPIIVLFGTNATLFVFVERFANKDASWIDVLYPLQIGGTNLMVIIMRFVF